MVSEDRLFQPLRLGQHQLNHRIVLAPMTRYRAGDNHVPAPYVKDYYAQRASTPGTLLVTEATYVSARGGGYDNAPGIWNREQVEAWKEVVDAVHAKGGVIFCQLWALGRVTGADPKSIRASGFPVQGPSPIPVDAEHETPTELSTEEVQSYVDDFANAAQNAFDAGFDGVEIHGRITSTPPIREGG